jgi:petrobactin synthase
MNRDAIIAAIRAVLEGMGNRHLARFGADARLNADLYLDSVLLLNLYLALETEHGIAAPEEVVSSADIETVGELASLLAGEAAVASLPAAADAEPSVHDEDYYDIKVHCFVSCLCAALKREPVIDHRPFYFGVWDADFAVSDSGVLLYHAAGISHEFFRTWFHRLYGVEVREWYDASLTKAENLKRLVALVEDRSDGESVMVMVDLHHLPERENKFNQDPFPHYLMVEATGDPEVWQVLDPDFRWEGQIERDRILYAAAQPTVAGGYRFDRSSAHAARAADVAAFFDACFLPDRNPLTDAVRSIIRAHRDRDNGLEPAALNVALREVPVISIRKYAYEHGFAYFWRALKLANEEFLMWCDEIDALAQGFKTAHFAALRFAASENVEDADAAIALLEDLDAREMRIKRRLADAYADWRRAQALPDHGQYRGAAE